MSQVAGTTLKRHSRLNRDTLVAPRPDAQLASAGLAPGARGASAALSVRVVRTRPEAARGVKLTARGVKLTARGRLILRAVAALFLLAVVLLAGARIAGASGAPALGERIAMPGDSLWSISESIDPEGDPRVMVLRLQELNPEVGSGPLVAGQALRVPVA